MLKNSSIVNFNRTLGIGFKKSIDFLHFSGLNTRKSPSFIKNKHSADVSKFVANFSLVGRKVITNTKENIEFLSKIKSYKGLRHKMRYPVRGQRTHTNAKTRKKFKF
jgi:small subunit ribosomal protein S13